MAESSQGARPPADAAFYDDLDRSFDHAWVILERGARDRRSMYHTPAFATTALDGRPSVRTVVLRAAVKADAILRVHSDRRSGKIEELARDPRCGMHFYDPAGKLQLRLDGTSTIHHSDEVAERAWSGSQQMSRVCYAQAVQPGHLLAEPYEALLAPSLAVSDGRANFCVILFRICRLEWLYLSHRGHRRAVWQHGDDGWSGSWVAP